MGYNVNVIINKDKDGFYVFCPELPGCHSQGDTVEEAIDNIKEAAELYLETIFSFE
jgi:predicted RNase H-like HicB family nuclease